jgi:proteasome accessory factor B
VDGFMARYVQEHHWHETQQFDVQPDGSVIVQFNVVPTQELNNWILKVGRHAEVLEPAALRQEIKSEIADMARRYGGERRKE